MPKYAYPYCYAPPRQTLITPPPHYTPPPTAWFSLPHKEKTPPKPTRVPPPSHTFSPPSPHKEKVPPKPKRVLPAPRIFTPPSPHNMPPTPQFAIPPSHTVQPPPPRNIKLHHTVVTAVCASLGGIFFIAFIAAALCCFIRKKKRMVHENDMVNDTSHVHVHETVIPRPHGEKIAAMTIDEDINVQGTMKKNEVDVHIDSSKKT